MSRLRVVVTGTSGFFGPFLARAFAARGCEVVTAGRRGCDVTIDLAARPDAVAAAIRAARPALVVNAAAASSLAFCAREPAVAAAVNAQAVAALASLAGVRLVQISTDLVFDGREAPYRATAEPKPLSVYGSTKRDGERCALSSADALVVRVPLLFGRGDGGGPRGATDALRSGVTSGVYVNEFRTPMHCADAAEGTAALALARDRTGIAHLAGPERVSRHELAVRFARVAGLDARAFWPTVATASDRPRDVSLLGDVPATRGLDAALADA